jgi:hypothetical protein
VLPIFPMIPCVFKPVLSVTSLICFVKPISFFHLLSLDCSCFPSFYLFCLPWPRACLPSCTFAPPIWIFDLSLPAYVRSLWRIATECCGSYAVVAKQVSSSYWCPLVICLCSNLTMKAGFTQSPLNSWCWVVSVTWTLWSIYLGCNFWGW